MEKLEIKDVSSENIDDLISLCIPMERSSEPQFMEGAKAKKKWATATLKQCGSIAKMAYLDSKPVGLIQYRLNLEDKVVR